MSAQPPKSISRRRRTAGDIFPEALPDGWRIIRPDGPQCWATDGERTSRTRPAGTPDATLIADAWDALRAPTPALHSTERAHITCRVCEKPARVPVDHPALLCPLCLDNLDATAAHVHTCLEAVWARWDEATERWQAQVAASGMADRWAKVEAAMIGVGLGQVSARTFDELWTKRKAEGGDFAALLVAFEAHKAELDRMSQELERWNRARDEVNAAVLNAPIEQLEKAA